VERRSFANGARVSVLGFGCGRVGSINNTVPMREIEATLRAAVEHGIDLFDTADIYAQGDSERTLSRLLAQYRDRMFVVTKVGGCHSRFAGPIRLAKPVLRMLVRSRTQLRDAVVKARAATVSYHFQPRDLRLAVDRSRRRLRVDRLDGLLLHSPSLETLNDHDFLAELLVSGQAAHVGASVKTLPEVEAAVAIPSITMLQVPLPVARSLTGTEIVERIRQRDIGVFVREILESVRLGTTPPQEAVSAAIAPDFITAAIIGVSTRQHLSEAVAAVS